jgi:hypothetical protein
VCLSDWRKQLFVWRVGRFEESIEKNYKANESLQNICLRFFLRIVWKKDGACTRRIDDDNGGGYNS